MDAIEHIACRSFGGSGFGGGTSVPKLTDVEKEQQQKIHNKVAAWWEQNRGADEAQWAKEVLFSDTGVSGACRGSAIDSLYRRLGKESYPLLAKAYLRLPKGHEDADTSDETRRIKNQILHWLLKAPTKKEKGVFISAVHDAPQEIRFRGAKVFGQLATRVA